jgi:hypothetical protein
MALESDGWRHIAQIVIQFGNGPLRGGTAITAKAPSLARDGPTMKSWMQRTQNDLAHPLVK